MVKFQLHLGFPFSSQIFHRSSVDDPEGGEIEAEGERESGCRNDLISPTKIIAESEKADRDRKRSRFSILAAAAAFRKSLAFCSIGGGEEGAKASMDIDWPTDVQHVSHVTFDRFDGFLGLPVEFQPDVPSEVPSASVRAFGVSAESMQCSYDSRGNSVPSILLSMQRHLYSQGGLQTEGIFRINADKGLEMLAREQLNQGIVPHGIDLHCLAGLIKAWFRELPSGVLDSLPPEQVVQCNASGDWSELVRMLPATEAALLDWAINLMADVVDHQRFNKMNARSIAIVFAPNMTQMADPLILLIHVVQLMNFLSALIVNTLRERRRRAAAEAEISDRESDGSFRSIEMGSEVGEGEFVSGKSSSEMSDSDLVNDESDGGGSGFVAEGLLNGLSFRRGVFFSEQGREDVEVL